MWKAYTKLKIAHKLPSEDLREEDSIAAHCVDDAVLWFGLTVEATLTERTNTGTPKEPKWEPTYTLTQLLDPLFRVPRPRRKPTKKPTSGFAALLALAKQQGSGVKLWTGAKPS